MKLSAIVWGLALPAVAAMSGCATASARLEKTVEASWAVKKFRLNFTSGPSSPEGNGKTLSYYRVRTLDHPTYDIVVPSAQTTSSLRSVRDPNPKSYIRLIEDPANRLLLIEENVLNDCGPCVNYALIEPDPDYKPRLRYRFLKFPVKPMGNATAMGVFCMEYPSVTALRGSVIEYKYGNLPVEQCEINALSTSTEPTPPG